MIDEKKQQTAPLQQLSVFASKADQTIEEWIQHFIKQIEQESAKPD